MNKAEESEMSDKDWIRELEREVEGLTKQVKELKGWNEQLRYENERLRQKVRDLLFEQQQKFA